MHVLADKSEVIEEILDVCQPNAEDRSEIKYEVPFLVNFEGKSPMDILNDKKDYKGLDMMLQYLAGYDYDHHSRAIELPSVCEYINSRLLQTEKIAKIKKGMIKRKENPGVNVSSFWYNQDDIDGILQPAPIESELCLEFVDIPKIHTYTDEVGHDFMSALASTQEMDLFNQKPIKKLIEYKWPLVKYYTIRKLFIPFVGYLFFYMIYMNEIYVNRQASDLWMIFNYITMVPLLFFACYFIYMEMKQLWKSGIEYLYSFKT